MALEAVYRAKQMVINLDTEFATCIFRGQQRRTRGVASIGSSCRRYFRWTPANFKQPSIPNITYGRVDKWVLHQ